MAYVIGIDTGGTYTDAVLFDTERCGVKGVVKKAKAFTTHDELEIGIRNSVTGLVLRSEELEQIQKVVLSTTLATNAIVERKLHDVGLILIGEAPKGDMAAKYIEIVPGKVNIKGRVIIRLNEQQVLASVRKLIPFVESIAISGAASVRNPVLESRVKELVNQSCDLPVMCGHELAGELGYLERTNTVTINAGLLPAIGRFLNAVTHVFNELGVTAPVFVVRGDGSLADMEHIRERPVETVLSGPATSMIGAINLTDIKDAVVADMGGTTTDIGIVENKKVQLSPKGANIGGWELKIKSAKLSTFGLGGDSNIKMENEKITVGPERTIPACRSESSAITPTDILHYTGAFQKWSRIRAISAIDRSARENKMTSCEYITRAEKEIIRRIYEENIFICKDMHLPVCAIGAPAKAWYSKAREFYEFTLIVPQYYEVANAVGAATAGIEETVVTIVRKGEEGHGYLVHTGNDRFVYWDIRGAIEKAIAVSRAEVEDKITGQGFVPDQIQVKCTNIILREEQLCCEEVDVDRITDFNDVRGIEELIESRITASANGKVFV